MPDNTNDPGTAAHGGSPDELDKALRVTSPGVWMILIACFSVLFGILAWAFFGTVTTGIQAAGEMRNGQIICLLDDDEIKEVHVGQTVEVDGVKLTIKEVSEIPLSRIEALRLLEKEYLVSRNMDNDWAWSVVLEPESKGAIKEGSLVEIYIETERVSPISRIWEE